MLLPVYSLLSSLQGALANCVTPELRAIAFNVDKKKQGVVFSFYYDAEITYEIEDRVSTLLVEVSSCSNELELCGHEVVYLDSSKPIPSQEGFAFLRYENRLPKFTREKESKVFLLDGGYSHLAVFGIDMQQALLGRITSDLRYIGLNAEANKKKLTAQFVYDGEISELNRQLATTAIQDSRISFPDFEMESLIERVDYPNDFVARGKLLAYWRQEWIYRDNKRTPAIRK
ncbi:MAG TPA: hypothetical protein VLF94_06495 [Chlamydiales bacterium]|nr:hypothetical protein [Chlamydiales bacterium]